MKLRLILEDDSEEIMSWDVDEGDDADDLEDLANSMLAVVEWHEVDRMEL